MIYPSLSDMLKNVNSRYLLVNVISRRARELAAASERRGESLEKKSVSLAIEEVADGVIRANIDS